MPLNPQYSPFPPIALPDRGWAENLRAVMRHLVPGAGVRSNLALDLPLSAGQPTTGFLPTLTTGEMIFGDSVLGITKENILSAQANWNNKKLYFGLNGMYYGDTPLKATDTVIGEINTGADSILSIAQPMSYGGARFGVRGTVHLAKCVKGADVNLFTWTKPADAGLPFIRVTYAHAKTAIACTAGNATGDSFVLKAGSTTLVTHPDTALSAAGTITAGLPVSAAPWVFEGSSLTVKYNQTDASGNLAGGKVDFIVEFELL